MSSRKESGQPPFVFTHCEDLRNLPAQALPTETHLHGGFAVDKRPGYGQVYYGMPGCGIMRVSADLTTQEIIDLPSDLKSMNFHSITIGEFDGKTRLFLPANNEAQVAVLSLDGDIDFILPRPVFEEYEAEGVPFRPTDTVFDGETLFVADGYGANYISTADVRREQWSGRFGGKTTDGNHHGQFGTAHGLAWTPDDQMLAIADRPHSRIEIFTPGGQFTQSYGLPPGSRPCGIDYIHWQDRWYIVVGSLDDPEEGRPAPIYILDGETYELISTIRPKEDLGIERADHIHNVVWHTHNGQLYLIVQSWNPGYYFVLAQEN
jgi:hypothetical protein